MVLKKKNKHIIRDHKFEKWGDMRKIGEDGKEII